MLAGAVTETRKSADIVERIAKVKGVQAIDNRLVILPASESDDRLRVVIATAIYRDEAFTHYSMVDPPVHVIVNNGHVTLVGFVRSQIELHQGREHRPHRCSACWRSRTKCRSSSRLRLRP